MGLLYELARVEFKVIRDDDWYGVEANYSLSDEGPFRFSVKKNQYQDYKSEVVRVVMENIILTIQRRLHEQNQEMIETGAV